MGSLAADDENFVSNVDIGSSTEKPEEFYYHHTPPYWTIACDIINIVLCTLNVAANVFLIYVILRFKRLRNRTNYYILNFAITNSMYHVLVPIITLFLALGPSVYSSFKVTCYVFLIEEGSLFITFLFGTVVALDWYLANYHTKLIYLHKKLYSLAIAIVYIVGIVRYIVISTTVCLAEETHIIHFLYITYILSLVSLIIVNILRYRRQAGVDVEKTKYSLTIANIIVFSWLPMFSYYVIMALDVGSFSMYIFLEDTIIFPKAIAHTNSIVVLFVLGRIDKHFMMAYTRAFKRSQRNYENDELDRDSDDEAIVEHQVNVVPDSIDVEARNIMAY